MQLRSFSRLQDDHTPAHTLHWLPVQQRIDYKVALLTFTVGSTSTPSYLRLLIQDRQHGRNLRSTTTVLCQPSTTTTFVKHPCRCSAPAVWNSLPKTSVNSDSVTVFKRHFSSPGLSLFPLLSSTLPGFSASKVTTLQRYTDTFIIIIIISVKRVQSSFCQVSWCTMVFKVSK